MVRDRRRGLSHLLMRDGGPKDDSDSSLTYELVPGGLIIRLINSQYLTYNRLGDSVFQPTRVVMV